MSSIIYWINNWINNVLSWVVTGVPIGTNLGLFHLLWMLLSDRLLQSRGAGIQRDSWLPGRTLFWDNLVLPDAHPDAPTFISVVMHDPRFAELVLLNASLPLSGAPGQAMSRGPLASQGPAPLGQADASSWDRLE